MTRGSACGGPLPVARQTSALGGARETPSIAGLGVRMSCGCKAAVKGVLQHGAPAAERTSNRLAKSARRNPGLPVYSAPLSMRGGHKWF